MIFFFYVISKMLICKRKESKRKKRKLVGPMTWPLMWFNRSVAIINVALHLLNIYLNYYQIGFDGIINGKLKS